MAKRNEKTAPVPASTSASTANVMRRPAEDLFADELKAIRQHETTTLPPSWRLSPRSVLTYINGDTSLEAEIGGKRKKVAITRKFFGDSALVERAIVTLVSERASLLVGDLGTGKSWLSEHLAAAINGDDTPYIARCKDFIASMRKADPSIVLVSSFPSQKVLDALGKDLGYLAPHHYTRDLGSCEQDFQKLAQLIAQTQDCGHLRLAVTEWNFTAGDWGLLRARMLTLEGALPNARYLNLLCRNSNIVDIACRSNMTNSFCSGIIETRPCGLLLRPSFHVMKL